MTQEFYAVVKTAIKNTNWDESQKDIVDRVLAELETLYKAEVKPKVIIEGLGDSHPTFVTGDKIIEKPEEIKTPMPDSIKEAIQARVDVLKENAGLNFIDPADLVHEEPLGMQTDDEKHMEEADSMFGGDINA